MMRKSYPLLTLLLALVTALPATAQTYLGYSDGTRASGYSFGSDKDQGLAIRLPKEKAAYLKGCKVTGIRTVFRALQNRGINFFVTKELGGTPLAATDTTKAKNTWTVYPFSTPVEIDGSELYAGFVFTASSSASTPLGFDGAADFQAGTSYALVDGTWEDYSNKGYGAANVQLVLDNAPSVQDLMVKRVIANGVFKKGRAYSFSGEVYNFGTDTVRSITYTLQIGSAAPLTFTQDSVVAPNAHVAFTTPDYTLADDGIIDLKLTAMPDGTEADATDNTATTSISVLSGDVKKKILAESFTGQTCSNCPPAHENMDKLIAASPDDYVLVEHHAGFAVDRFTMTEDYQFTVFYGDGGSYAPAMMFDRRQFSGMSSPVFYPSYDNLVEASQICLDETAPVTLELHNDYDPETKRGTLSVDVNTLASPSDNTHYISVWITQDSILGIQYSSTSGVIRNYVHNAVYRSALTSPYGTEISLEPGTTTHQEYTYLIPDVITSTYGSSTYGSTDIATDPQHMNLVVFISDVTSDINNCPVFNAETIPVYSPTDATGIHTVAGATTFSAEGGHVAINGEFQSISLYDTAGRLVRTLSAGERTVSLPAGTYIARVHHAGGTVKSQKILVK